MPAFIPEIPIPGGGKVPILGQGTWGMGDDPRQRADEVAALRRGIELGMTLIDTAEMYADGGAEEVVAEAVGKRRHETFLVSKVLPSNASKLGTIEACERSLQRLKTDRIDLYLLHWRGRFPLSDTLSAFEVLKEAGKIRYWGVSNFDTDDVNELVSLRGGSAVASNQVLYNLSRRGIEFDLLPWCRARNVPVMAYSPIEQGRLLNHAALKTIAGRHDATPSQIALSWLLRQRGVIVIPKSGSIPHVEENRAALDVTLTQDDLTDLNRAFLPPTRKRSLEML